MQSFEQVAEEWNSYRKNVSTCFELFMPFIPKFGKVLDAGCGNGRNSIFLAKLGLDVSAVDISGKMIQLAKGNAVKANVKIDFHQMDISKMAINDEFRAIFCIAAFHHLNKVEQLAALKSFQKSLKKNGLLFLSVWNKHQKKFENVEKEALIKWKANSSEVLQRYYYFFEPEELKVMLENRGFKVEKLFFEKKGKESELQGAQNVCLIARKS